MDTLFQIARWADIIVVGRKDQADFYAMWGGIREFFNIPIVIDTDDNVRFVRPTNPGYSGYFPGSEALVWNKYGMARVFDAVTVSTQELVDVHKKECPKIYVLPNNLDVKEWNNKVRHVFDDGFTTLAFIGSSAHHEGVQIIKKPVLDIMQKYPKTKFLITHVYSQHLSSFPADIKPMIEYVPWIPLEQWPADTKKLGIDIGLAPLADNMFNRAKSNLRWMEYSMAHISPIVSPVKAYDCVEDGKTGLVAKEQKDWFNAMEKLITDKQIRRDIADNAYNKVSTAYNIDLNIELWNNTYKEICNKFHEYWGKKKEFISLGNGKFQEIHKRRI
mgnify:CR=1 FL=1